VQWAVSPYLLAANASATVSGVVSVSVAGLEVTSAPVPLVVTMTVGAAASLQTFQCSYWSDSRADWTQAGTAVIGFERNANGDTIALCATLHLTDFSAVKKQTGGCG
jgi:hypothetical protein